MSIAWRDVGPVIVSILIIIAVADRAGALADALAAVLATMPINVPLAMWVVYSGAGGDRTIMAQFTQSMLIAISPPSSLSWSCGWRHVPAGASRRCWRPATWCGAYAWG